MFVPHSLQVCSFPGKEPKPPAPTMAAVVSGNANAAATSASKKPSFGPPSAQSPLVGIVESTPILFLLLPRVAHLHWFIPGGPPPGFEGSVRVAPPPGFGQRPRMDVRSSQEFPALVESSRNTRSAPPPPQAAADPPANEGRKGKKNKKQVLLKFG